MEARPAGRKANLKRELTLVRLKVSWSDSPLAARTERVVTAEAAATLRKIPSSPIPFIATIEFASTEENGGYTVNVFADVAFIPRVVTTFKSVIETKKVARPFNLNREKGT